MSEPNIVKKVFDRASLKGDKISPLFTHYKTSRKPKQKSSKPGDGKSSFRRLPVAVDFGVSRLKLLQLAQDDQGGVNVALMDEELLGENSSDVLKNKEALQKLLARNSVGPQAIIGLPARETQTFNFTFPLMQDDELREAVRWKIRQLRPFDLDEDKVKYALMRWEANGAQQRVTVVCVAISSLSWKITLLNEAGLKPISVQISPLSLVETKRYANVPKNPDEVVLWLDLGAEESVFIVEKGGVIYFMRNLSVTGNQMTRQVAQSLRTDEQSAEELKTQHGLGFWTPQFQSLPLSEEEKAKNPSASVCLSLVSLLENLVLDIEHSFKSFSYQISQSQISKFDRVVLTGGSANLKKIDSFLSDRLAVPVDRLDPFYSLGVQDALRAQRRDLPEDGPRFASAVGLALSQLPGSTGGFNLIAPEKKKKGASLVEHVKARPKAAVALAVVLIAVSIVPQVAMITFYRNQAQAIAQRVKDARVEIKRRQTSQLELAEQEKQLFEKKAALEEKLALFKQSGRERRAFSGILTRLASLLPDEVWVTKLSYSDKKLVLVASTSKNEAMIRLLDNLKRPDDFSEVVFNYTKRDAKSSVFSFEVMMSVK